MKCIRHIASTVPMPSGMEMMAMDMCMMLPHIVPVGYV